MGARDVPGRPTTGPRGGDMAGGTSRHDGRAGTGRGRKSDAAKTAARAKTPAQARSHRGIVARHGGHEVPLTKKEFDLLHYLLLHRGRVLTRLQLGEHLWGNVLEDDSDSNYIDVHIKNVRKKLAQFGPADFSGIDGTRELFIGDVVHQAIIEVDEEGTEAAAATAIGMRAGSAMPTAPPRSFIADRPFAFFLQDARTGVVLFMGRVADPTAK